MQLGNVQARSEARRNAQPGNGNLALAVFMPAFDAPLQLVTLASKLGAAWRAMGPW